MKARILAQWVIGITIVYPIFIVLVCFFQESIPDAVTSVLVNFCIYLMIPVLIIDWIFSVWSLKLEKKNIGYWALFLTIIYTLLFSIALYLLRTVKMC
ncbi:ABC-type enterochelin transport system permease subunit [Chryseobacterium sediminis]|jgi:ABC-type enterochelin transport system permease subunit|nr:ABC-type enterochelin transport system permease subunit [Chryseobacterium sediminis]